MSKTSEYARTWRLKFKERDPEGYRAYKRLQYHKYISSNSIKLQRHTDRIWVNTLKKLYGLTIEDWNDLLQKQNGLCALCGLPPIEGERFAVDHDHKSGKVRGLVHRIPCNLIIGYVEKYPTQCVEAVQYLSKFC